ncbi:putative nuclease HARBI1 [Macrobrachium nipponense]|uniref:putative nuclease HARBI1 n=1 Tax=Macrobrachium nipponense TaxID=159736 RepID=UPI0030C84634
MVERLTPLLKKDTKMWLAQEVGLKLAVTLRHLASGNDYTSLQYSFRVSKSSICRFIPLVCQAIIDPYKPEVMKCPKTPEEWNDIAKRFASKWNYFNCVGALDGKHIAIKKPKGGVSLYFNYKKFHSIVPMALSDAKYKFLFADIGAEGGAGDGGTWQKCNLARAITNNRAGVPQYRNLPNDDEPIPFHIVADDAFALNPWLMKPYSHQSQDPTERICSYRLSRTCRVVENSFGLLHMKWRVSGMTMQQDEQVCKKITLYACVMHNLALQRDPLAGTDVDYEDQYHNVVAGTWREESLNLMKRLMARRGPNYTRRAKAVRDYLAQYYSSDAGTVEWQERKGVSSRTTSY